MWIFFLILFAAYFMTVESPKWLIMKGRHQEAIEALKYIARVNKSYHEDMFKDTKIFLSQQDLDKFYAIEVKAIDIEEPQEGSVHKAIRVGKDMVLQFGLL